MTKLHIGDWVKGHDYYHSHQGLVVEVSNTHFCIRSKGQGIPTELFREDFIITKHTLREELQKWWRFL